MADGKSPSLQDFKFKLRFRSLRELGYETDIEPAPEKQSKEKEKAVEKEGPPTPDEYTDNPAAADRVVDLLALEEGTEKRVQLDYDRAVYSTYEDFERMVRERDMRLGRSTPDHVLRQDWKRIIYDKAQEVIWQVE